MRRIGSLYLSEILDRTRAKKGSAYFHTNKRLKERYGFEITRDDYHEMCKNIKDNLFKYHLRYAEDGARICKYTLKGVKITVAFDTSTNSVRTVFPKK